MMRIDGLYVPHEVFRICNELVDDVVTVTPGEIGAAVRDCFEDALVLEPAGALSIAGLKKWVEARPISPATGQKGNYIAVCSDAANIELVSCLSVWVPPARSPILLTPLLPLQDINFKKYSSPVTSLD